VPQGVAITDYLIEYSSDAGQTWNTYDDGVSRSVTAKLSLENGQTYRFRVAALTTLAGDTAGLSRQQGQYSAVSAAVTPFVKAVLPAAPVGLSSESLGGSVRLFWTPPAVTEGGAAVRYVVQYRLEVPNAKWIQTTVSATTPASALIGRLGVGKSYSFRVAAVNQAGQGDWSEMLSGVLA
jgi:hypothetical protein